MLPSRRIRIAFAVVGLFLVSRAGLAQTAADSIGPRAGSWGAEVSNGSSTALLHFSSPSAAWMLRANFTIGSETQDIPQFTGSGVTSETNTTGSVLLQGGRRWWSGEPSARLRPLTGLGLMASYSGGGDLRNTGAGAYGELGATYFFSPHVSLGATGELDLRYSRSRSGTSPLELRSTQWQLTGNLARLNASVYF